jgi:predicted phosphoribosyltransferase
LLAPEGFWAIGQFYEDFTQVEDEEVIQLLRQFSPTVRRRKPAVPGGPNS